MKKGDLIQSRAIFMTGIIIKMFHNDPKIPPSCDVLWHDGTIDRVWCYAIREIYFKQG
jgi:hypothetical protein